MINTSTIINLYTYFYGKKYNSSKYKFSPPSKAISKIAEFLKELDKKYNLNSLGKVFITQYFLFQFNRTHKQVFQRFASRDSRGNILVAGKIQIYDIIGKKAFKYWLDRDIKFDYVLLNCEFLKECNIRVSEVYSLFKAVNVESRTLHSEEIEKSRFFNTRRGFINCIEKTTLFNHYSQYCITCLSKVDCKKVLSINYPSIYKERYAAKVSAY